MPYVPLKRRIYDMSTAEALIAELESYFGHDYIKGRFKWLRRALRLRTEGKDPVTDGMNGVMLPGDSLLQRIRVRDIKLDLSNLRQYVHTMDGEIRDKQTAEEKAMKQKKREEKEMMINETLTESGEFYKRLREQRIRQEAEKQKAREIREKRLAEDHESRIEARKTRETRLAAREKVRVAETDARELRAQARESRLALREKSMAEARDARAARQDEVKKLRAEIRKLKGETK